MSSFPAHLRIFDMLHKGQDEKNIYIVNSIILGLGFRHEFTQFAFMFV